MLVSNSEDENNAAMICNACYKPAYQNKKLLRCQKCQCALYHDSVCQSNDWKNHKRTCSSIGKFFVPLRLVMTDHLELKAWSKYVSPKDIDQHEILWRQGYQLWYESQDYLKAMELFQISLQCYQLAWRQALNKALRRKSKIEDENPVDEYVQDSLSLLVAKRILFCAYCEMDGQDIDAGRDRLVQCISILKNEESVWEDVRQELWDDAWAELVLSLEEIEEQRHFAKHVVLLSIAETRAISAEKRNPCGWNSPWQRPGYMASPLTSDYSAFVSPADHPHWCSRLEEHFEEIFKDYKNLQYHSTGWSKVGSGVRGESGLTDHRVVAGNDWSEYVLFGQGEIHCVSANKTKSLLREIIPDAISLAEDGGGEVIFSRLAPRTHIRAHCGPTNFRMTAHLGLVLPSNTEKRCQIRVGASWHRWEVGKILLFDDSYEHEVVNESDEERVVLLLRFWHPGLSIDRRQEHLKKARYKKEEAIEKRYHPPPPN